MVFLSRVTEKKRLDNFVDELRFGHLPEATGQQLACKQSIPTEVQHNVTVMTAHITGMPAVKHNTAVEVMLSLFF